MAIKGFRGEYYFLSNFSDSKITIGGYTFQNGEAAFHSFKNEGRGYKIGLQYLEPSKAKQLGRRCKLRSDWEEVKDDVMYQVVYAKFSQNEDLKKALLATGDKELIEENVWHDNYWGVCICNKCTESRIRYNYDESSYNHLGKTLMRVRDELR